MWFSRKVYIHPQHLPVQWNLRVISIEQSTEKSKLAAIGLSRPRHEKFCGCFFESFNSMLRLFRKPHENFFSGISSLSLVDILEVFHSRLLELFTGSLLASGKILRVIGGFLNATHSYRSKKVFINKQAKTCI
jgi:hypothetical protein